MIKDRKENKKKRATMKSLRLPMSEKRRKTLLSTVNINTNKFYRLFLFDAKIVCETKSDLKSIMRRYGNYVYNSKLLIQYRFFLEEIKLLKECRSSLTIEGETILCHFHQ
jgi:hypothetical protein